MQIGSPSLLEQTRQTESATVLIDKTRAKKAVEAADKMLTKVQMRMKEAMTEVNRRTSQKEVANKKVGPATGLASDVAMLLE